MVGAKSFSRGQSKGQGQWGLWPADLHEVRKKTTGQDEASRSQGLFDGPWRR